MMTMIRLIPKRPAPSRLPERPTDLAQMHASSGHHPRPDPHTPANRTPLRPHPEMVLHSQRHRQHQRRGVALRNRLHRRSAQTANTPDPIVRADIRPVMPPQTQSRKGVGGSRFRITATRPPPHHPHVQAAAESPIGISQANTNATLTRSKISANLIGTGKAHLAPQNPQHQPPIPLPSQRHQDWRRANVPCGFWKLFWLPGRMSLPRWWPPVPCPAQSNSMSATGDLHDCWRRRCCGGMAS